MVVFFIILTILFFMLLLFFMLCLSNLEIEVNKLFINTSNKKYEKLQDCLFYIRVKLLDKITWIKIKIDKKTIKKIKNSSIFNSKIFRKINKYQSLKKLILEDKRESFKKSNIKELDLKIKKFNLDMNLCTADNIFTSFCVAALLTIISIIIARSINKYEKRNYNYIVTPIYKNKPSVKINLNCIISLKIVHIIEVIYMVIKKGSVKYDERTSNRRTYASIND